MPDSTPSKIKEFPSISSKLTAPGKKSLFERQKAEAEAKRQREEAETAAVYADFVRSFEDDSSHGNAHGKGRGHPSSSYNRHHDSSASGFDPSGPPPPANAPGRRHFAPSSQSLRASGPGSLGPGAPPPLSSRKRGPDGALLPPRAVAQTSDRGLFAFEDGPLQAPIGDAKAAFLAAASEEDADAQASGSDETSRVADAPKPTLRLTGLPPGTSQAEIRALFAPSGLAVEGVRSQSDNFGGRKAMAAIVTLPKDTPASEMDAAVSALQNRYLGYGFYLGIGRHLSSAALGGSLTGGPSSLSSGKGISSEKGLPFGAKPAQLPGPTGPMNRAPPPGSLRANFAPPSSYGPGYQRGGPAGGQNYSSPLVVTVNPPSDLKQLKLIHKTLETLLTHGPEFEALLMSRPAVQRDEKWAWLWDARSQGGVYYRWRLWELLSRNDARSAARHKTGPAHQLFSDGSAPWMAPNRPLRFEFTTRLEEFVSDSEYDSSEEEASGDEAPSGGGGTGRGQGGLGGPTEVMGDDNTPRYLDPLRKAKLTHLLARLPTTTARLRKGDVARVTAFAIQHAGRGADEVVRMLVENVEKPVALGAKRGKGAREDRENTDEDTPKDGTTVVTGEASTEKEDTSSAKLIALFLISDILASSSTSGVRHAWRYRQLFEAQLRARKTFEKLGGVERDMAWGRLRAEKWRRAVTQLLGLWEGWCVFGQKAHEEFLNGFVERAEGRAEKEKEREERERERAVEEKKRGRWKTVEERRAEAAMQAEAEMGREVGSGMDDVDGEPIEEEDDVDGEPMDEDVDGEPMDEDVDGEPMDDDEDDADENRNSAAEDQQDQQVTGSTLFAAATDDHHAMSTTISTTAGTTKPSISFATTDKSGSSQAPTGVAAGFSLMTAGSRAAEARKRRPKAVDMFADSDEE